MRPIQLLFIFLLSSSFLVAQENYYFPDRNAEWAEKPSHAGITPSRPVKKEDRFLWTTPKHGA